MSLFLSGCPLWLTAILIVIVPTIAASWGSALVRGRVGLALLEANNEVAGFKFAVVGVIYAVLLAFAVIVVWERYTEAEVAVVHEAGAAATLYRLAAGPEPEAVRVRAALERYLELAIEREWPKMASEKESSEVTAALSSLYTATLDLAASGARPNAVLTEMFTQLGVMTQERHARVHFAVGIMPSVLWAALSLGGVLTVAFTYFFGAKNWRAQILMTSTLALIVFMGLFVIVAIDHPFTGPVHVDSVPLQRVLADVSASSGGAAADESRTQ